MKGSARPTPSRKCLYRFAVILLISTATSASPALAARPLGIDVSYWQGSRSQDDWDSAYASGRVFAFIRATHYSIAGESDAHGNPDPYFVNNMTFARNAGVLAGAYHYARPDLRSPAVEAEWFLSYARPYIAPGYLPPMLDMEGSTAGPVGAATHSDWANQWMNYVSDRTGVSAMVYCNYSWARNYLYAIDTSHPLVFARWSCPGDIQTDVPRLDDGSVASTYPWSTWRFWQYCGGPVPGFNGNIDLDVYNGTMAQLQAMVITPTATITAAPASLSQTVTEGQNAASQTFTIRNTGTGKMAYDISASSSSDWLAVSPTYGSSTGETDTITVSYLSSGLSFGVRTGTITITSNLAPNSPQAIAVTLTVNPPSIPGDLNHDAHVNSQDVVLFSPCMTGSNNGPPASGCGDADVDGDGDADQADFGIMQRCFSGSERADPDCH
jgi:GH25 family lysozyme M1 (1,4-beta-N-acetylmuramidase)